MDRSQVRRLLWRWGRVLEYCRSKQREIEGFQDIVEAQTDIPPPKLTGLPKSKPVEAATEAAAIRLCELTDQYREVLQALANDVENELRFMRAMDALIEALSCEQQKVLELRYKGGYGFEYISLKMVYSIDRAKHIEAEAIDILLPQIEVSTF